jgi:hypothetical protein
MQGFDTLFGLVVDTENTYEYTGDVYGLLHEYTRYKVIGVMLVSFNNMEFKQVSLEEFKSISLNNYSSNSWAENKWTSFLYPHDTEPVIIVDRYKYSGSNLIENVKTLRSYEDENDIILLYDKDGKLIVRSGCDIIHYEYSEHISLTVDLHTHSIGFSPTQRLSDNLAKTSVRKNYFNHVGDIYYNVLKDVLTCGTKHVLVCEDIVEVCADCDKILLPSECRTLYLDDGVAVNQIVCNKEIEHIVSCTDYPVGEWYISKESLVSFVGDLISSHINLFMNTVDGSTRPRAKLRKKLKELNDIAYKLCNSSKYEQYLSVLREPKNKWAVNVALSELSIVVY